jgi:hypothetical protein
MIWIGAIISASRKTKAPKEKLYVAMSIIEIAVNKIETEHITISEYVKVLTLIDFVFFVVILKKKTAALNNRKIISGIRKGFNL